MHLFGLRQPPSLSLYSVPLLLVLLHANPAFAERMNSIFSFKAFGTLAATGTDTDAIGFRRDTSTAKGTTRSWDILTDSRLGLQIDARFDEALSATVQWTLRDRAGRMLEQNLDLAFLRWNIQPDLSVRLGRVSTDVFMLSDHRNVGYAYPWMRPPHEFYAQIPIYHWDGLEIAKKIELDGGYLTLKAFGGYTSNQVPSYVELRTFEQSGTIFSGSAVYDKGDWKGRISYSQYEVTSDSSAAELNRLQNTLANPEFDLVWPHVKSLAPLLKTVGSIARFSEIGAAYDDGTWLAQAEASYIDTDNAFFPSMASGYLSLGRRFSSLTLYTLMGMAKTLGGNVTVPDPLFPDPGLVSLQQVLNQSLNNRIDEQSLSLGVRWDFYTNMAFKAQWSHFWLGSDGTQNWITHPAQTSPGQVNVFSVGIDFIF